MLARIALKATRSSHVIALGGGEIVAKEAEASLNEGVHWTVYALSRGRKEEGTTLVDFALGACNPLVSLIYWKDPNYADAFAGDAPPVAALEVIDLDDVDRWRHENPGEVAHVKGFRHGICEDSALASSLQLLQNCSLLVWDGDAHDETGFTVLVPSFLRERPERQALAFTADRRAEEFRGAWQRQLVEFSGRITLVSVDVERCIARLELASERARVSSFAERQQERFFVGRIALKSSGSKFIVALGGDGIVRQEAEASLNDGVQWTIFALSCDSKNQAPSLRDWATKINSTSLNLVQESPFGSARSSPCGSLVGSAGGHDVHSPERTPLSPQSEANSPESRRASQPPVDRVATLREQFENGLESDPVRSRSRRQAALADELASIRARSDEGTPRPRRKKITPTVQPDSCCTPPDAELVQVMRARSSSLGRIASEAQVQALAPILCLDRALEQASTSLPEENLIKPCAQCEPDDQGKGNVSPAVPSLVLTPPAEHLCPFRPAAVANPQEAGGSLLNDEDTQEVMGSASHMDRPVREREAPSSSSSSSYSSSSPSWLQWAAPWCSLLPVAESWRCFRTTKPPEPCPALETKPPEGIKAIGTVERPGWAAAPRQDSEFI